MKSRGDQGPSLFPNKYFCFARVFSGISRTFLENHCALGNAKINQKHAHGLSLGLDIVTRF